MKILRWAVTLLIMFLIVFFVIQNSNLNPPVKIHFFWKSSVVEMDVLILVFLTFILGLVIGFLITGIKILASKNELRVLSNDYKKLKKEVDLLRNQGLEETENSNSKTE
ncbi:MAG TPA: LapA family protein [Candidatus Marinimicrobia bacterium]|nr:LapA family protein [Candidatus Neomarinimicrobiota bacterium]HRS51302.1 LapA family protein [Candidatus Neomarinimicrobiota bacterium]HRU91460.1 LapA family protein [Candidatus Neomarinimicrobiota bacterium]